MVMQPPAVIAAWQADQEAHVIAMWDAGYLRARDPEAVCHSKTTVKA